MRSLIVTLIISAILFPLVIPTPIFAGTDPISSTVSATARVPSQNVQNDTISPVAPILIRPSNDGHLADNTPELVWTRSTDANGNTVTYTLYLNNVATYLGISNNGNSEGSGYTARIDGNEVRLIPRNSLADGTYSWYVSSSDLSGNTSHSQTWNFTIDTQAPPLTLVDLNTYHLPSLSSGSNFDIDGPTDVYFHLLSDPFVQVTVEIETLSPLISTTNATGSTNPYTHLKPGTYLVKISALDQAQNSATLPPFTITIRQAVFAITIPGAPGQVNQILVPYSPLSLPSYPATIARISSDRSFAILLFTLIAIGIILLLIIIWKRRYNLLIIDTRSGKPISTYVLYHSKPQPKVSRRGILLSTHEPLCYQATKSDRGRLYIRGLGRYSTLTIRVAERTYILSISRSIRFYTITL